MITKIYIDMDGVLADFDRGAYELCGVPRPEPGKSRTKENDDLMWERIRTVENFYDKLEPMAKENAPELDSGAVVFKNVNWKEMIQRFFKAVLTFLKQYLPSLLKK